MRPLGEDDVVLANGFIDQAPRVGLHGLIANHGIRRRERGNDAGGSAFEIPEVMHVAVREDDEAAVLRAGILARLFLPDDRVLFL